MRKLQRASWVIFCAAWALIVLTACRSTRPEPAGSSAAPAAEETSVRPGINANYRSPDLDVGTWVSRFESESREIFKNRGKIMEALAVQPGQAVADVGAGTGLFVPMLSRAVGANGTVYAVDIVPDFLELIQQRVSEAGIQNVKTVLSTDRSVALPEASIDLAFLCDVYHHLEYPRSALASVHRALRSGGALVVIDFKRVPGESEEWVLNHVRGGQELFRAEIEAAGFDYVAEHAILKENYMLRFRKAAR